MHFILNRKEMTSDFAFKNNICSVSCRFKESSIILDLKLVYCDQISQINHHIEEDGHNYNFYSLMAVYLDYETTEILNYIGKYEK